MDGTVVESATTDWCTEIAGVPGGMGLFLVEKISTRWGVERMPGGANQVWFELAA